MTFRVNQIADKKISPDSIKVIMYFNGHQEDEIRERLVNYNIYLFINLRKTISKKGDIEYNLNYIQKNIILY